MPFMNIYKKFLKDRKGFFIVIFITALVSSFYFNVSGKNDSSFWDVFLYICLPVLIIPIIYYVVRYLQNQKDE